MSNGSIGQITVESAPREADKLANIGRFQLRRLADELGLLTSDAKLSAFMGSTPGIMAQAVAAALKTHDGSKGETPKNGNGHSNGNGHAAAATAETVAVSAAPETPAADAPPAREPRTRAKAAATTAAPAMTTSLTSNGETGSGAMSQLLETVKNSQTELMALNKRLKKDSESIDTLTTAVLGLAEQNKYLLALVVMLCEADNSINASRSVILTTAVADMTDINEVLGDKIQQAANPGKE